MVLVPILNITFIKNHANNSGGALYFGDSQCSSAPLECFFSILNHSSYPYRKNLTLLFKHNSAGSTGSALYGGHLSECRLYYRTSYRLLESDACDTKLNNDYSTDALDVFKSISKIIQHNKSVASISSPAKEIISCNTSVWIFRPLQWICNNIIYSLSVYLGQQFNITLRAIDQGKSPVPANILSMVDNSIARLNIAYIH